MGLNQLIYRVCRPLGGLAVARYLTRWHPRVLMYHRIGASENRTGMTVDIFRQQMKMIKQSFNVITLDELVNANDNACLPRNAVVVTFDDGYHDFADYAFPVLKELDIPATLFVTTGFVEGDLWLWPDQIRYALDNTRIREFYLPNIPKVLNIAVEPEQCWHQIADHCMVISNIEKLELIDNLFRLLDVEKPNKAPTVYRPLTWEQIREMVAGGLDIGSHSHSHPILTQLEGSELQRELFYSRSLIEKRLACNVRAFCYPNGQQVDFNERIKSEVRDSGYEYAVAAFPGADTLGDRWAINRYPVSSSTSSLEKTLFGLTYLNSNR